MRLIDADGFKSILMAKIASLRVGNIGSVFAGFLEAVIRMLDLMPTVEAEAVVHAHWEYVVVLGEPVVYFPGGSTGTIKTEKKRCSHCHKTNKNYAPPFCPHCGARMDEED